jgi:RHS repeat-associated protein
MAFNGTTLSFDANGNLTGDGTYTYTYDTRNHLTAISGGTSASFAYDAFGRWQSKVTSATTQYLYDGLNPVQELGAGSNPPLNANLLTGLRIDEYFARTDSSGNVSSFMRDALGSTVGLVGSAGTIATSYTYQPFGATTVSGAANGNVYQFTGRENDGTAGLYYYRARYYSPSYQRFAAQDPIDFRGRSANLYAYVNDGPLKFTDPRGTCPSPTPTTTPTPSDFPFCVAFDNVMMPGPLVGCVVGTIKCLPAPNPPGCIEMIIGCGGEFEILKSCANNSGGWQQWFGQ